MDRQLDRLFTRGGLTDDVQLGLYFYPKGQEPKFRQVLHLMGATNAGGVDIPGGRVELRRGKLVIIQQKPSPI